ncbi:MAG: hypothetical protein H5T43_06985 [Methanomethylovorans sp.]|nr:hypothetical protein [Methanomethylovorans sp.]
MKLVIYINIVLIMMSVFSTVAFAASGEGKSGNGMENQGGLKKQDREQNRVYAENGNETDNSGKNIRLQNNQENYFAAKERLQHINAEMNSGRINSSSKEVFEVRKDYLLETINYTIFNLEELKEKIEQSQRADYKSIISDLDNHIAKLYAEKMIVENATTTKELAKSARNIRDIWRDAVKDAYNTRTKFVEDKVGLYLNKSVSLSQRLSKEIDTLRQQGENTTELDKLLKEYESLIEQATLNRERAREAYQNGDYASRNYWSASVENLKEANSVLAEISQIIKVYRQGVVFLNADDSLTAEGNGTVVISGDVEAKITMSNAQLVIKDHAGDGKIKIVDENSEIIMDLDNSLTDSPEKAIVYSDLTGKVSITGSRLTVMIRGNNLYLEVEGIGNAMLTGSGIYTTNTNNENKHWASQLKTVSDQGNSVESGL